MKTKMLFLCPFFFLSVVVAKTQTDNHSSTGRAKVGIFIPLYLDSAFTSSGSYKYNNNMPKFMQPGFEFYNGVQIALDSLQKEGLSAEVFIIDSKDRNQSINGHITQNLKDASLLIGMLQNATELKTIADAAYQGGIPLISATYPNDGGIIGNPSLVILNATLRSHCQAIYKHLAANYGTANIIIASKPGVQEEKIKAVLEESNKKENIPLKWKSVNIASDVNSEQFLSAMDSTKNNVLILASMDDDLGESVIKYLSSIHGTYRSTIIGMPTWDDFKFDNPDFKGVEILYSTPFLTSSLSNNRTFNAIAAKYRARSHSRPGNMVYRGFEITYRYIKNMLNHQDNIIDLSDHAGKIFSDFDIQPVKMKTTKNEPDYYENKKVYFIKKTDGVGKVIM